MVYSLPKPGPLGQTVLALTPLEFEAYTPYWLATSCRCVLGAPNRATPLTLAFRRFAFLDRLAALVPPRLASPSVSRRARASCPPPCRSCVEPDFPVLAGDVLSLRRLRRSWRIVGSIQRILAYLGEPTKAPRIAPVARSPPAPFQEDFDMREGDTFALTEPLPEYELDQRVSG